MKITLNTQKELIMNGEAVARVLLTSEVMNSDTKIMTRKYKLVDMRNNKIMDLDSYVDFRKCYKTMDWINILKL